ncbi:hypothetical protein BZA77DRAFT_314616 [Pyronema omphalodes]|nr:hypothetical protein BZA77DRAFT_314616 [Pyronema omphalodes]
MSDRTISSAASLGKQTSPVLSRKRQRSNTMNAHDQEQHISKSARTDVARLDGPKIIIPEEMISLLTCAICFDFYFNPVKVEPCGHNYCGSCASQWYCNNHTCPTCRSNTRAIVEHPWLSKMISVATKRFPDRKRDPVAISECEKHYRPGDKIKIRFPRATGLWGSYSDEEDEYYGRDTVNPCMCCTENNYGYRCPVRTPHNVMIDIFLRSESEFVFRGHAKCGYCSNLVPTGWRPYQCDSCHEISCAEMFGLEDCDGPAIRDISDPKFSPRSILARDLRYFNALEKEELVQYVMLKGISERDICSQIFRDFVVPELNERIQTICSVCSTREAEKKIMEWWIRQKKRDVIQESRKKCPYGYHCKEQDDESHRSSFCHSCNPSCESERNNADAPTRPRNPIPRPPNPPTHQSHPQRVSVQHNPPPNLYNSPSISEQRNTPVPQPHRLRLSIHHPPSQPPNTLLNPYDYAPFPALPHPGNPGPHNYAPRIIPTGYPSFQEDHTFNSPENPRDWGLQIETFRRMERFQRLVQSMAEDDIRSWGLGPATQDQNQTQGHGQALGNGNGNGNGNNDGDGDGDGHENGNT